MDWEELGEDVTAHAMFGLYVHSDGRECRFHSRLRKWAFSKERGTIDKRCLRPHGGKAHNG